MSAARNTDTMQPILKLVKPHGSQNERIEHCDTHGQYTSKLMMGRTWTKCNECIQEQNSKANAAEKKRQADIQKTMWAARVKQANIQEKHVNCTLANYEIENAGQQAAVEFASDYIDNFAENRKLGRGAIFLGLPGTGKNHIACAIALELMKKHFNALVTTHKRMNDTIKGTWNRKSVMTEQEAIKLFVEPDLLVLDEYSMAFNSDTDKILLFDVVNSRYERCKPTIVISNLKPQDFKNSMEPRVLDRLCDNGGALVKFVWQGRRQQGLFE